MTPLADRARLLNLRPPVRRVLIHSLLLGLALNIADLLFNFYLVSQGYGTDTAGLMSTVSRVAGMLLGIPMGLFIDRIGAQRAIQLSLLVYSGGWLLMLQGQSLIALMIAQFIIGAAFLTALTAVVPLLATITSDDERTGVFGLNASATMVAGLGGGMIGGLLPSGTALLLGVGPQDTAAYRLALGIVVLLSLLALLPILRPLSNGSEFRTTEPSPLDSRRLPNTRLIRFSLSAMFLGIGSGVILPFQNLFFRDVFGLSDSGVGIILATVAVCMGLGALIGAPLGARIGLRRGATILRMISVAGALIMLIPSLIPATIGFIIRGTFIVASYPMSDALVMANTPLRQRGMAMSLSSVFWAGGWAVGALAGGYMQVRWGFNPLIIVAAVNYLFSALAIWTLVFPEGDKR